MRKSLTRLGIEERYEDGPRSADLVASTAVSVGYISSIETISKEDVLDMRILESYGLSWSIKKVGRDVWQNFFDGNGGTLDGVNYHYEEIDRGKRRKNTHRLVIHGDQEYDLDLLTRIGATTKEVGGSTAGGFGEGAKMLSLSLLRDYNVSSIRFGSNNWMLDFFLDDVHDSQDNRGLFALTSKTTNAYNGNFLQIESEDKELIENILFASNFFESSSNPHFQDPTLMVENDGVVYRLKYEGIRSNGAPRESALYVAGQRRQYGFAPEEDNWINNEGLTLAISGLDLSHGDRDRGGVTLETVKERILKPILNLSSNEDLTSALLKQEEIWPSSVIGGKDTLEEWQKNLVGTLSRRGVKLQFDPIYYADDEYYLLAREFRFELEKKGYIRCPEYFVGVGMIGLKELYRKSMVHEIIEPTEGEKRQIEILQDAGLIFRDQAEKLNYRRGKLEHLPVHLFDDSAEGKEHILGTHQKGRVWLSLRTMSDTSFSQALATYLHELDHRYGNDMSKDFSYALTDTIRVVLETIFNDKELWNKFEGYAQEWLELAKLPHDRPKNTKRLPTPHERRLELGFVDDSGAEIEQIKNTHILEQTRNTRRIRRVLKKLFGNI